MNVHAWYDRAVGTGDRYDTAGAEDRWSSSSVTG